MNKRLMEFPVNVYGKLEKINDVLSKARVRIFYRYGNRNGTYITDEFAAELCATLPGVPVKGIYEDGDYTDHGSDRTDGQVYGFVPETNNFAWEKHLDEDGIEREYACCDVYLFTALYPEASDIVGKSQSMELFAPTLEYHYAIIQGQKYVVFDHGSFLGLQVLGDHVEPCFEGASFFSLQQQIQDTIQKIKEYSYTGGKSEMPELNFKLSDSQKHDALWILLNENYNEENGWAIDYAICDIYDEYALAFNYAENSYERVYYEKDDSQDSVSILRKQKCYIIDVSEEEKAVLDTLHHLNGDTYAAVDDTLANAAENATLCEEYSTKLHENEEVIATYNTEAEQNQEKLAEIEAQYAAAQDQIADLSGKVSVLETYKANIETQHKEAVIAEYADKLSEEVLDAYKAKIGEYTVEDLDMHLAYEWKRAGSFTLTPAAPSGALPKDTTYRDSVNEILARYKR